MVREAGTGLIVVCAVFSSYVRKSPTARSHQSKQCYVNQITNFSTLYQKLNYAFDIFQPIKAIKMADNMMETDLIPITQESSSIPSSPEIDLSTLPRLDSSRWGDQNFPESNLYIPQTQTTKNKANLFNLSSDPTLFIDSTYKTNRKTKTIPKTTTKKRNRIQYDSYLPASKSIRITPLSNSVKQCNCICFIHNDENQCSPTQVNKKIQSLPKKNPVTKPTISVTPVTPLPKPKFTSAEEALYSARDKILEAYKLTSDRESQKQILDFLNLFRAYTEKGYNAIQGFIKLNNLSIPPRTPLNLSLSQRTNHVDQVEIPMPPNPHRFQPTHKGHSHTGKKHTQNSPEGIFPHLNSPINLTHTNEIRPLKPSYAQAIQKPIAPDARPLPPTKASQPHKSVSQPVEKHQAQNTFDNNISKTYPKDIKVITLVLTKGSSVPNYQATQIRDKVNKAIGKIAISRVHTSPRNNIVLTCFNSTPEELLEQQSKWEKVFANWPISKAQKVETWPNVVIHGVPSFLSIDDIPEEISSFNPNISIQGKPRWLTGPPKTDHGSIVMTVSSEAEKNQVIQTGVLISGLLLRVVNYKPSNEKTLCSSCLKYGHHHLLCKRKPVCAICIKEHKTSEHSCSTCKASGNCSHHLTHCLNCKSSSHTALQKKDCEFYKALL